MVKARLILIAFRFFYIKVSSIDCVNQCNNVIELGLLVVDHVENLQFITYVLVCLAPGTGPW